MSNYAPAVIEQVFNHIALPPRLPDHSDDDVGKINEGIIKHGVEAAEALFSLTGTEYQNVWTLVKQSLYLCGSIHEDGNINRYRLRDAFSGQKETACLILHISQQNAGLLILPVIKDRVIKEIAVECFEASPTSQSVLACTGALKCDYPGSAVTIPLDTCQRKSFQEVLATFLEQADEELIDRFAAKSKKAGATVNELRDTASPDLITQMLMCLLEAHGSQTAVPILRKRIRDDVCWNHAFLPWRRSPFYLVIRVCIQRMLYFIYGPEQGRAYYKVFIAMVHARLLQNATGKLPVELCHFLRAKLCRRLSKLEAERSDASCNTYSGLLDSCSANFSEIIQQATLSMDAEWRKFKNATQRCIPALPLRADKSDMCLQLPNSIGHLKSILNLPFNKKAAQDKSLIEKDLPKMVNQHYQSFSERYHVVHTLQRKFQNHRPVLAHKKTSCTEIAGWMNRYLDVVSVIEGNVQELSLMMVDLFELWVIMDTNAVQQYPLLAEYSCGFKSKILDVLQLSSLDDLIRLQKIQEYITKREKQSQFRSLTIFSDPKAKGFSDKYVRLSADTQRFQMLEREIQKASDKARMKKSIELQQVNGRYSQLCSQVMLPCTRQPGQIREKCIHCNAKKKRKKLIIYAHEDFLPTEVIPRRAVLFELAMPVELAVYRDTTWRLLSRFGMSEHSAVAKPSPLRGLLRDYSSLKPYNQHKRLKFHLGAITKSFLVSHYKGSSLPAPSDQVLLPFGPELRYYDTRNERWASALPMDLTFAHHFGLDSSVLALMGLQDDANFAAGADGRSSYEIMTRQNECPVNVTVHEYTTYQRLLQGQATRWLSLLRELGSSNLNFSQEATMHLISYLALQAGPNPVHTPLRLVHEVFEDAEFCHQLTTQVERILSQICNNWRESFCMDMLLTLILRILNLGPKSVATEALRLLHRVRHVTSEWAQKIRHEIQGGVPTETVERLSIYGLLSGILCKQTFSIPEGRSTDYNSLRTFFAACLAVQENIQDPTQLPPTIQKILVRDLRVTSYMDLFLRNHLPLDPICIESAIKTVWPHAASDERAYGPWKMLRKSDWWMESQIIATEFFRSQNVHYHPLDGHLLVDGKPVGKLPSQFRDSPNVQELFGNEHLLIFPSAMRGMEFMLATPRERHTVHFGRIKDQVVVRAHVKGNFLHLVPRQSFGTGGQADLPATLLIDCFHWLNLKTNQLEVRRKKNMWWFNRVGNWTIDIPTRQAFRKTGDLVDPHSGLFRQVAKIFDGFEDRENISVIQPTSRNILVEMKRMDLSFNVNAKGNLVCTQLHAEIDPDQDAGTWYGLQSGIVMRETSNRRQRSVIVPTGSPRYHRCGPHVLVKMTNDGQYGRYLIDSTLGRLKCEPDPLLVHTKSLLHALTSFPIPDTLTGRTGTEEAIACLNSASSQPWNPVGPSRADPLIHLTQLTPRRAYYPVHLKRQQQVFWDKDLTVTIQHDLYRPIIEAMATKLERLGMFALDECYQLQLGSEGVPHLRDRSYFRRRNFERGESTIVGLTQPRDASYLGRHNRQNSTERANVYEVVHILLHSPSYIRTPSSLAAIFDQAAFITGRIGKHNNASLNDILKGNLIQEWGPLTEMCRQYGEGRYDIMFKLATFGFAKDVNMDLLRTLAAVCIYSGMRGVILPEHAKYVDFHLNERPSLGFIKELIHSYSKISSESLRQAIKEHRVDSSTSFTDFNIMFQREAHRLATKILDQWPSQFITRPQMKVKTFRMDAMLKSIETDWQRLFRNMEFEEYLCKVQEVLDMHQTDYGISVPECIDASASYPIPHRTAAVPSMASLFSKNRSAENHRHKSMQGPASGHLWRKGSYANHYPPTQDGERNSNIRKGSRETRELRALVDEMMLSASKGRQAYAHNLKSSLDALESYQAHQGSSTRVTSLNYLEEEIPKSQHSVQQQLSRFVRSLTASDARHRWLSAGQLWPCLTPITILQRLRSSSQQVFGSGMKEAILDYGVAVTQLQQLLRICDAVKRSDSQRSRDEFENMGHENWQPERFPDWLLMEIDANILIRKTQVDVALATISPSSGSNSVLQMNMGQGKTSVVMPMALCVLANGKNLGRLMVPKSLLLQTAQTIQSRLGDLVGREVLHIPFSRKSPIEPAAIQEYGALHEKVLENSGIILTLPEHVLSFKLSGFQCLSDSKIQSASAIISTNSWLTRVSRDVIDECDFSLAVKTQLIYPSGSQLSLDGHPHRWRTAHILLGMVEEHLTDLETEFPGSLEVVRRPNGGFPFVHILQPMVEEALLTRLTSDLCSGKTNILPLVPPHNQDAVRNFISQVKLDESACEAAVHCFNGESTALKNLFLLRGLISHEILLLCLKKRWNVQYGLHPSRSPIAVPFHAKGVPSEQAEWGHPDVSILLTCLAFYYDGLSVDQLRQCLHSLSDSDDPAGEYGRWGAYVHNLPASLRHWNLISIDDDMQVREIWSYLRYGVTLINYFLDHCVFPVHAKQFSQRLQLSGWDVPIFSTQEKEPAVHTTGFSGTNDDRFLLPLTIKQNDLPALSHTNAEVLSYLLHSRNRSYVVASGQNGKRLTEEQFIRKLNAMNIRILIDAGAHILEHSNQGLARKWLDIDYKAPAAVYFDSGSKPWVMDRNYKEVPLLASSFTNDLDKCLVFLDEAHTRGTDLKFPPSSRAALTLSLGQTKDHTVQAAMRLRQLGTSQSVVFVASPEAHQSVLDVRRKSSKDAIDSTDVIAWLLEQTCRHHEQLRSLYLAQGYDFCRRTDAAFVNDQFLKDPEHRNRFLDTLLQKEEHSLKEIYTPNPRFDAFAGGTYMSQKIIKFGESLDSQRLGHGASLSTASTFAFAEVEQERECMYHVEQIREAQRPTRFAHCVFPGLHPAIRQFALTGRLEGSIGYETPFRALQQTTLGRKHRLRIEQRSRLFISDEFTRTIQLRQEGYWREDFLRPVHWLLWSPDTSTAIILIPEEAECVLSLLKPLNPSPTHLLVYAAPFAKTMVHFNSLNFYAYPTLPKDHEFPSTLKIELGLLSGCLFFTYDEYTAIVDYLNQHGNGARDSAILIFLQQWLSVTRKGREFSHTPMGYICQNRRLERTHAVFVDRSGDVDGDVVAKMGRLRLDTEGGDDSGDDIDVDGDVDGYFD
ncbi:hypothetical protein P170DRAFT_412866 [Aspergillus steynii IBT 23096]|uniref:ubiquitinyl hydrolase 1 n=1 Tax=Aspergillus steynii IBT 23096 TaxID=1392250 RepID=A0A2I2G2T1_9EURO|nr:uncharacterized protein P170DRAFT_412866 [Aspergillus steynii IBT 23096]PLB47177.1 hypothetical protein P170DRAFT_412866 [Aspergillus steynii IBT 23096]